MEENSNKKIYLIVLLIIFFIFLITGLLLLFVEKPTTKLQENNQIKKQTISLEELKGSLLIQPEKKYSLGEFYVDIIANSNQENVTAYDVLLDYDHQGLEFLKAESLDKNFDVYAKENELIFLTIAKKTNEITVFNNQPVVRVYLKALKTGQYRLEILSKKDSLTTKFVNDKTDIVKPQTNSVYLYIE